MKKIGLFFGSFDPPHIGHVDLVTSALNAKLVDRVMVIPAWQNVWKKQSTDFWIRLRMCEHAFKHTAIVSPVESIIAKQSKEVHTYDVVKHLKDKVKSYANVTELVMLTSSETWKDIPKWKNGELILKELPIIVEGIDFHSHKFPIYSTAIRLLIEQGKHPQPFIQNTVYEEIKLNKLYI